MKLRRMLALGGALILLFLFVLALVLAVTGADAGALMAVIFAILFISVVGYAMALMYRVLKRDDEPSGPEKKK